jgi:hypothetical protein
MPADPKEMLTRVRGLAVEASVLDTSHHTLAVLRCPCGQRYLHAFYELIDRAGGDDSQATVLCALAAGEGASWTVGDPAVEGAVAALPPRRQAVAVWPRNQPERNTLWVDGPVCCFPHD